jgi:hypothetical protein
MRGPLLVVELVEDIPQRLKPNSRCGVLRHE